MRNRQIVLSARPDAFPQESDFGLVESEAPTPSDEQVLVKTHYLSVDPNMRGRMRDVESYADPVALGDVMVGGTVGMGLLIAVLADRVKYEALAKAIIFMPMAISFVGAGIIWKFVYAYGTSQVQIGLLNGIIASLGGDPVSWLSEPGINNYVLIIVGVWMWTGFCMTILSAALKSVPTEIIEAARVDGATEWSVFWKIMVPIIMPTIAVVITTMVINVLKIFDIVYVMTGGNYGTEVIANRMYGEMYVRHQSGRSAAIAVILILLTIPFMIWNVRRFREQEAIR